MEERNGIPPYRMAQIMKTAADIADRLVNGKFLYSPTYRECEIILDLVGKAVEESKEEKDVFKQDDVQEDDQTCV